MNAIVPFNFGDQPVRVEDRGGQPWFVLADICRVLGHSNPSMAASRLDDDERDTLSITDPIGRATEATIISESGLWSLVLTSRKPIAKVLKKFVTAEVLPTLRRTGSYALASPAGLPRDPRLLLSYIAQQAGDMVELQDENAALRPKADALDRLTLTSGELPPTQAAKVMGVKPGKLFDWLEAHGWIYRGADGLVARQPKLDVGYMVHKAHRLDRPGMTPKFVNRVMLTPKGIAKLTELGAARE